jgi:hypothetical protein
MGARFDDAVEVLSFVGKADVTGGILAEINTVLSE